MLPSRYKRKNSYHEQLVALEMTSFTPDFSQLPYERVIHESRSVSSNRSLFV